MVSVRWGCYEKGNALTKHGGGTHETSCCSIPQTWTRQQPWAWQPLYPCLHTRHKGGRQPRVQARRICDDTVLFNERYPLCGSSGNTTICNNCSSFSKSSATTITCDGPCQAKSRMIATSTHLLHTDSQAETAGGDFTLPHDVLLSHACLYPSRMLCLRDHRCQSKPLDMVTERVGQDKEGFVRKLMELDF